MSAAIHWHGIATGAAQLLIYSTVAGTLLAVAVWLLLRVFPRRDSRTSFAVWFATLLATALLPLLSLHSSGGTGSGDSESRAVVTISTSWAWSIFAVWAAMAAAGLARVALATVQIWKLRRHSVAVEMQELHEDLRALIEDLQRSRPVRLLVSQRLEVPTAIGFRKPAIILPAWLLESTPPEELKYILLHELAHLWRRDDWTNLAQKILKALLFFLPSVWWIERRLSLDREMACDDRVLAHTGTPRRYAECLAHVAERSFLRRQLALAQAAVGRVRQLTARVAMILDPNRPRATKLWKPAIPAVIVLAGLSALPASLTPLLVSFSDGAATADVSATQAGRSPAVATRAVAMVSPGPDGAAGSEARAIPAAYRLDGQAPQAMKVEIAARRNPGVLRKNAARQRRVAPLAVSQSNLARTAVASNDMMPKAAQPEVLAVSYQVSQPVAYVTVRQEMFVVVTEQTASGAQQSWQMHVVEISLQPLEKPAPKPRKI